MNSRTHEAFIKYDEELIDLILNTESLAQLFANSSRSLDIINQTNDADIIIAELTKADNYTTLKQAAIISDYYEQVEKCVVMNFIDYALKKNTPEPNEMHEASESEESSEEIDNLQKIFCAIWLMKTLYKTDIDLYKKLFQPVKANDTAPFIVIFGPKTNTQTDQITYQFLFDPQTNKWKCQRFSPESKDAQIIDDKYILHYINKILVHVTPENLNPFIKKSLSFILEKYEEGHQNQLHKKRTKRFFKDQSSKLAPKVSEFCQNKLPTLAALNNIHIVHTAYFTNAEKKPALIAKLLLNDRLFELINRNSSELILLLAKSIELEQLQNLLNKEYLKHGFFDMDSYQLINFCLRSNSSDEKFRAFSKYCFEHASQKQLAQIHETALYSLAKALSGEDFIKYRSQGKIQLSYPHHDYVIEELYKSHPDVFPTILEEMLTSGRTIDDIPKDQEILTHFVNLLFKHGGQWFYLINNDRHASIRSNAKADLLSLAMKMDPQKTMTLINTLTRVDSQGNKFLPIDMTAEEITKLINASPQTACVLLDYPEILNTFEQETFSFEHDSRNRHASTPSAGPFGGIRRFDLLATLLTTIPPNYGEKLLRRGLLFAERGMPHFQHLSGFGFFGGKNPSGSISNCLEIMYSVLPCSTFMNALTEGLMRNQNVDRLFLKEISNLNLLELAKVMMQFQHLKHLELSLSLNKDNQDNIIKFFAQMGKTNPYLHYHIQIEISEDKKPFEFITHFLSKNDINVISLTIQPQHTWVKLLILDKTKPDLKNFLDACIKKICQNNSMLRRVSVSGLSRSVFQNDDEPGYTFTQFPIYNTRLFSMDAFENISAGEKDETTEKLLSRNRNILALKVISDQFRHFQNVLELLPWLTIHGIPPELVVDIFDRLNYRHSLPSTISPYRAVRELIAQTHKPPVAKGGQLDQIENALAQTYNFLKAGSLRAYYRHKPHKENIHALEAFFSMDKIQSEVINLIIDWFRSLYVTDMLDDFRKLNQAIDIATQEQRLALFAKRSSFSLILTLDGISTNDNSLVEFRKMINKLYLYQKAVDHASKNLCKEAYVELQLQGPFRSQIPLNDLALQSFDGYELHETLVKYNPKNDISKSSNLFSKIASYVFTDFDNEEKIIFKNIMQTLELYLKQKEKPAEKQCDKHKHQHKNNLLNLMKDDNIEKLKNSKHRLYQILATQQKRLATSVSKCSVKLVLRHSGLFSVAHEQKKVKDKIIISKYADQLNKKALNGNK